MSQTDTAPTEVELPNPEGTQETSEGKESPADLKKAVADAVTEMFAVNQEAWHPKRKVKFKIDLPSGQSALVKFLDTMDLMEFDLIEELDFFTRKLFPVNIDQAGNPVEAQQVAEESIWAALRDPEKRKRFLDVTGKLMATASVRPAIIHDGVAVVEVTNKRTGQRRVTTRFGYEMSMDEQLKHFGMPITPLPEGCVYSGWIDMADRMAWFQELNKPLAMIEPFREGSSKVLQDMARGEGHGGEAK